MQPRLPQLPQPALRRQWILHQPSFCREQLREHKLRPDNLTSTSGPGQILKWSDKCVASASSTTRTVAVAGCATQPASNHTADCDKNGGGILVVHIFGAGCTYSTPRPVITIGDGVNELLCIDVRAPTVVPDPSCGDSIASPQAYACTLPALTNAALLNTPLAVRVKWPQDTTVQYLAELAGRIPTNVTAPQTTNAVSEATVSYSCVDRTCNSTGAPRIV